MQPPESYDERRTKPRGIMAATRFVLLQLTRLVMVVVLVAGVAAVSLGLATVGRERPTTDVLEARRSAPAAAPSVGTGTSALDTTGRSGDPVRTAPSRRTAAELVAAEDERVLGTVRAVPYAAPAYRVHGEDVDTLVLTERDRPYGRKDLAALGALVRLDDGSDFLRTSVLVAPGATLELTGPRILRLRSVPGAFVSIVAWKGGLRLQGTDRRRLPITSWSLRTGTPDHVEADGRAYVRTVGSRTEVHSVSLHDLGFWSGRTGGLAAEDDTNGAGTTSGTASPAAATGPARRTLLNVDDLVTRNLRYGVFLDDLGSGRIRDSRVLDSGAQGILLHGRTQGVTVADTAVRGSGSDGIAVSRGGRHLRLEGVTSSRNGRDGIRLDGRPEAVGATAGGGDPSRHGDVTVQAATLAGNAASGATVVGAERVSIAGSTVRGNRDGIVVRDRASDVRVTGNRIEGSRGFGVGITDGPTKVLVEGNSVTGGETGVAVRAAVATVRGNTVRGVSQHGVSLTGHAPGSQVVRNQVAGAGPTAIGLSRLVSPATVVVAGNRLGGWEVHKDETWVERLMNHPLLGLWLPILLLPLVAAGLTLRRRRRTGSQAEHGRGRLSVATPGADPLANGHPAAEEPDPDTRTRVTVMA